MDWRSQGTGGRGIKEAIGEGLYERKYEERRVGWASIEAVEYLPLGVDTAKRCRRNVSNEGINREHI
jgi:hypothetical protein